MSIFGSIKKAIFGDNGPLGGQFSGRKDTPPPQTTGNEPTSARPAPQASAPQSAPAQQPAPRPAPQPVDVEAVLEQRAQASGQKLNWRTSIVDLMKLLGLDPSLSNREELADELGYTGAKGGSAEMNTWLIKAVMRELEKNGGQVPAALRD